MSLFFVLFCFIAGIKVGHSATIPRCPPPYRKNPPARLPTPQIWCLYRGETLKSAVTGWAQRVGWSLQWELQYDYPIMATACFRGTFLQVMPGIAHAYSHAERPFYLDLYPKQRLVVLSVPSG